MLKGLLGSIGVVDTAIGLGGVKMMGTGNLILTF